MEDQLKQYLQDFVETLKAGGNFAVEQLPLFVKEYLMWGFWESMLLGVIFICLSIGLGFLSKFIHKKLKENDPYDDFGYFIGIFISGVVSAGFFAGAMSNFLIAIKITVAPRVYLIENLMNLF